MFGNLFFQKLFLEIPKPLFFEIPEISSQKVNFFMSIVEIPIAIPHFVAGLRIRKSRDSLGKAVVMG